MSIFRKFLFVVSLTLFTALAADELSDAYLKEYTFLKAQKDELTQRVKKEKEQQDADLVKVAAEVERLQNRYVELTKEHDALQRSIEKANEELTDKTSNAEIISSVAFQAKTSLEEYGATFGEQNLTDLQMIEKAFDKATSRFALLSSIQKIKGDFLLMNGMTATGDIVKIGNIAAYGLSSKGSGALAPAGAGTYKLWNKPESAIDAKLFYDGKMPSPLHIFVYENLDKDIEYQKEKSIEDTIEAGGVIGLAIIGLGMLGLLLILVRASFLAKAGSNVEKITQIVYDELEKSHSSTSALEAIKEYKGSTARVIKSTLRNIKMDREHIEDIVTESILNESSQIDRFGSFVLVIAAVAPLMGLLGTVTGMITTFDIITVHGTGDPKLLSGGISEALVTTMLGLIVAIPLLLLGNLLSGWANNIKDSMEQGALHIVNLYEKYRG